MLGSAAIRQRRLRWLLDALPRYRPLTLLDVGGTVDFWGGVWLPEVAITILNLDEQPSTPGVRCLVGDARDLSAFADQSIDVVHSNSVIGHVGGPADRARMAREIQRVGRWYWVQTPDRACPIDWCTGVPFFHRLPAIVQTGAFWTLPIGRYSRANSWAEARHLATSVHHLSRAELQALFPTATIRTERVCQLPKSLIAYGPS
jgi:Methyltransferase domain